MALSPKRQKFVDVYLKYWNATKAAEEANYAHPGQQGHRLLKNVEIAQEITRRLQESKMSADEVLSRLSDQGRTDIGPYVIQQGKALALDWEALKAAGLTHLVKSIIPTAHGTRIEFHDAQAALAHLGKAHGLFVEKQVKELSPEAAKLIGQLAALVSEYVPEEKRDELKEALQQWVQE